MLEARYYFSERVYYHHAKVSAGALVARAVELAVQADVVLEEDFYAQTDASVLDLLERRAARAQGKTGDAARRIANLVDRFRNRRLLKRACVFPRYANEDAQADLVARFFSPGNRDERLAVEDRIADVVRFATGREVEIIVYCPAARMQLKEAQTHVRWPGVADVRRLSEFATHVPRLADLERSYRDLWKFYVLADAHEPKLLRRVQEIACDEFRGATNVYRIEGA
jgi:HD superfamily phosphohydrolase